MDNQQQQPQPAPQMPSMPSGEQIPNQNPEPVVIAPKKKRTGLIVGIVLGSLALILIVAAVLLYFLWWQNPKKMVTDSVVNLINTKQIMTDGKMTISSPDVKLVMEFSQNSDGEKANSDITIKIRPKDLDEDLVLKFNGVYAEDGTIYVKADGIKEIIDKAIDEYTAQASSEYSGGEADPSIDEFKAELEELIDPIVDRIDGEWLKISRQDMVEDNEAAKCMLEMVDDLKNKESYRKEIIEIYKENDFLIVKDGVPSKNGATGFEIDVDKDKVRDFGKALERTEAVKRYKSCSGIQDFPSDNNTSNSSNEVKPDLLIWVDPWSHQLKSVEMKVADSRQRMDFNLEYNLEPNKSKKVDIPSNARSAKEVYEEIEKIIKDIYTDRLPETDDEPGPFV